MSNPFPAFGLEADWVRNSAIQVESPECSNPGQNKQDLIPVLAQSQQINDAWIPGDITYLRALPATMPARCKTSRTAIVNAAGVELAVFDFALSSDTRF